MSDKESEASEIILSKEDVRLLAAGQHPRFTKADPPTTGFYDKFAHWYVEYNYKPRVYVRMVVV